VSENAGPAPDRNLARRLGSSALLIPIIVAAIWMGGWTFAALVGLVGALATREAYVMLLGRAAGVAWIGLGMGLVLPFVALFPSVYQAALPWTLLLLLFVVLGAAVVTRAQPVAAFQQVPPLLFGFLYGVLPLTTLVPLRGLPQGFWWVVAACAMTWMNDTGAFFVGRAFGRHKLHPRLSPAKTWEGFFGGMAAAVGTAFALRLIGFHELGARDGLALGVAVSLLGPLGDLAESLLKRSSGVKDSGRLIPGHGGILDRIDALIFTAPCVYFYASRVRGIPWQ
jgi:phosphatidate cytidylyltransferase